MTQTTPKANSDPQQTISTATPQECAVICQILGNAFSHDPVMNWMNADPAIYPWLFRSEAEPLYLKHGRAYINQARTGAALWLPPGISSDAPFHWSLLVMLWKMARTGGLQSLRRGTLLEKIFAEKHLKEPHHYLFAIGAMDGQQGKGIGSALLRAGLQDCDKNPHPAFLESSNIKNNILYERFGFRVFEEVQVPNDGPTIWLMRRESPA